MFRLKHGRRRSSSILFASELPTNEKAYSFALARALEMNSNLILFHALDHPPKVELLDSEMRHGSDAVIQTAKMRFEPLARRANERGVHCKVVVRPGVPAEEILNFLRGRKINCLVMGAHTSGPVGKVMVGSVAETMLRSANVPVNIVGPYVEEGTYRNFSTRTVLCSVNASQSGHIVAEFAAEQAARFRAHLILLHVIPPQNYVGKPLSELELEVLRLIPAKLQCKITVQVRVVLGDQAEELLYQGRHQQANFIVLDAEGASHFAAVTCARPVYKVLAYARCPVIILPPAMLAAFGGKEEAPPSIELNYLAGVF